jgi:nucleoside-diphosphate-sugar epimerase
MDVVVFGATGPTGVLLCEQALAAGHSVRAVSRGSGPLPISDSGLTPIRADAVSGEGVREAVLGTDAVLSVLGAPYSRHAISIYSMGTAHVVEAIWAGGRGNRLVVVSSGLTYPAPGHFGWVAEHVVFPILRNGPGRTLYADMRRMEECLRTCGDIDWTVMRPGRLTKDTAVSNYRLDDDFPTRGYTARGDLAAAMLAELGPDGHIHRAVAPTTR